MGDSLGVDFLYTSVRLASLFSQLKDGVLIECIEFKHVFVFGADIAWVLSKDFLLCFIVKNITFLGTKLKLRYHRIKL